MHLKKTPTQETSAQLFTVGQMKEHGAQKAQCTCKYMRILSTVRYRVGLLETVMQRSPQLGPYLYGVHLK